MVMVRIAAVAAALLATAGAGAAAPKGVPAMADRLRSQWFEMAVGADGSVAAFRDRKSGANLLAGTAPAPLVTVKAGGKSIACASLKAAGGAWTLGFPGAGSVTLRTASAAQYATIEVAAVSDPAIEEISILNIALKLKGEPTEPLAAVLLALNLQTNVPDVPKPGSKLQASCIARFGLVGAKIAIVAAPPGALRTALQKAVTDAPDVPHSPIGGAFAMGQEINQGSYLFNFGDMSEDKVDNWIRLVKALGMNQIDFHGGSSFRFGDCNPNPVTYPRGFASFKAVVDKLHAAGIKAGLHTYAFFLDKKCPWVTPVPDPRLAHSATFTLSAPIDASVNAVPVVEPTTAVQTVTGFFVRNSVTLRIDQELITFEGVTREAPFRFTGCKRGALGTRVAAHAAGATAYQLKECFGLFVPDPDTSLLAEVAQRNADAFNAVGFDMMYLDALDGEDILGGGENSWHYGSRFVWELWKRLKKPALMEMSTFHHHLWYVRSRLGAWDHPTRSHKEFIDAHVAANEECHRMFLPGQLGWWAFKTWTGPQGEPTFSDDIEYLMCKGIGTDTGFALMGIDPNTVKSIAALERLGAIIRRYEDLRHSGKVLPAVKAQLARPTAEHTLVTVAGKPHFAPVRRTLHRVDAAAGPTASWSVPNPYAVQPLRLRIEALMAAAPYDSAEGRALPSPGAPGLAIETTAATGVTTSLAPAAEGPQPGAPAVEFRAANAGATARGAWCSATVTYATPLDLSKQQAIGVWVYGDGKGEVLNLQMRCPSHVVAGIADHYIPIDFTGWRYFELVEPESRRWADFVWPYGGIYSIYREGIEFDAVASLGFWYNNLPPGGSVACRIGEVRALPLAKTRLLHPSIRIGDSEAVFPMEIESGSYLEYDGAGPARLYGEKGQLLKEAPVEGAVPNLARGANAASFRCQTPAGVSARARVNVWTLGKPIAATR